MNIWIYDENSYPSGFAGGLVPETMPDSRGRGLAFMETNQAPQWSTNLVGVYRLGTNSFEEVTAKVTAGEALPETNYLVASEVRATESVLCESAFTRGDRKISRADPGIVSA